MSKYKKKTDFFETEDGVEVVRILKQMSLDDTYNTRSSYSANTEVYPDNLIPFVQKHVDYLRAHPAVNPRQYIANLRLRTRLR